jgi:hypothetical protein
MTQAYRFFPWVRRGLATSLPVGAPTTRSLAKFKVTLTPEIFEDREVLLLGPGDVIGIDTRLIVRTDPRRAAIDTEPNYLTAIEFDAPDFPWLFTPSSAAGDGRLSPWIVLVVLDADLVGAPKVTVDCPLPWIELTGDAPKQLPDLKDSWAWAHAQRLTAQGDTADAQSLDSAPDLNVSRLVCPRRLDANTRYLACVVPAWEVGRLAGLGLLTDSNRPADEAPLDVAWRGGDVRLPIYYHWEFATGDAGDFEALARRLKPMKVSAHDLAPEQRRLGRVYLGAVDDAADTRAAMPPDGPRSSIRFDAPLEAMDRPAPALAEVPPAFAKAVDREVSPDGETEELLPPVYGNRYAQREDVDVAKMATDWLDELNLDPRTRLAARLGGDVIRKFQEELMNVAWEQVGDVIAANAQLSRSRFLATVATRTLERNTAKLSPDRFLMLTSVLHQRTRVDDLALTARIARTSLPDRAFDPALRRLASPVGRAARISARALGDNARVNANPSLSRDLVEALQRDQDTVDPGARPRDGVAGFDLAERLQERGWDEFTVRDNPEIKFSAASLAQPIETTLDLRPRDGVAETGLFTEEHFKIANQIAATTGVAASKVLDLAAAAMRETPNAVQIGIRAPDRPGGNLRLDAIVQQEDHSFVAIEPGGTITKLFVLTDPAGNARQNFTRQELTIALHNAPLVAEDHNGFNVSIREVDGQRQIDYNPIAVASGGGRGIGIHIRGGLHPLAEDPARIGAGVQIPMRRREWGRLVTDRAIGEADRPANQPPERYMFLDVMPPFERPAMELIVSAYKAVAQDPAAAPAPPVFLRANLSGNAAEKGLAATVKSAIEPEVMFKRRAQMLVALPGWIDRAGLDFFEAISAAPVIDLPFADLFAKTAPERLLPAEVAIPDNCVVALQTNPRFVAAFMVGANHDMNRELLWRTYPTDTRGTSLTRFWNWFDPDKHDVEPIHLWPAAGPLVAHLSSGTESHVAVVVRGRLLQRYPNTHLLLWKAKAIGQLADVPADPNRVNDALRAPMFKLPIDPDLTVAGFEITRDGFLADPGWYLILQEPVTEARFGLDDNQDGTASRRTVPARNANDLNWKQVGVKIGEHLSPTALQLANGDAAAVAGMLLQRQVRFAIHSRELAPMFVPP